LPGLRALRASYDICAAAPSFVTPLEPFPARPNDSEEPLVANLDCLRAGLRILALRALGNLDAAEEAVQETLVRAVDALRNERLVDPTKLAAYVAGIARHVCSHMRRDEKHIVSLDVLPVESGIGAAADPLEALISAAETARLRAAFGSLSGTDQHVLRLCFYENQSPAEVATALREPAERVRKRKSRALERLRRAYIGGTVSHETDRSGTDRQAGGERTMAPTVREEPEQP